MVNYQVRFSNQAEKDKKLIKEAGLELRVRELLKIMMDNPFQNPPPYEKLVGNLRKFYSRRMSVQHRLVYEILKNTKGTTNENGKLYVGCIKIIRMWSHYEGVR